MNVEDGPTDADVIARGIELRDRKLALKKKFNAEVIDPINEKIEVLKNLMLARFISRGTKNSSANGIGTAYTNIKVTAKIVDRMALIDYVTEHNAWQVFSNTLVKSEVQALYDLHAEDQEPWGLPGVQVDREKTVTFRK